eukprot:COSAG03_NODE_7363_length_928_cov_1.925211_1_plen_152_part_01
MITKVHFKNRHIKPTLAHNVSATLHATVHGYPSGVVDAFAVGISGITTGCMAVFISSRVAPNISRPFSVWFAATMQRKTLVKALLLLCIHNAWQRPEDACARTTVVAQGWRGGKEAPTTRLRRNPPNHTKPQQPAAAVVRMSHNQRSSASRP